MPPKTFRKYIEDRDQESSPEDNLPGGKSRNGLADPDPGEIKKPHNPSAKDISLAKEAVQLIMLRSLKWHNRLYKFLQQTGFSIPDVGRVVDQMTKPRHVIKPFSQDREPDELMPNSADTAPPFFNK